MNNNQDVSKYFVTNPPIFDATMLLDPVHQTGPFPRRRRISISNGQIHQMIDAFHNLKEGPSEPTINYQLNHSGHNIVDFINHRDPPTGLEAINLSTQRAARRPETVPTPSVPVIATSPSVRSTLTRSDVSPGEVRVKKEPSAERLLVNGDGIPQHQLFYNNELIFNPHDGAPMSGTAAWKRERLLERNRLAASKCRQRKKMAQEKMERKAEILANENRETRRKYLKMRANLIKYQTLMESHLKECESGSSSLRVLRELIKLDNEEIQVDLLQGDGFSESDENGSEYGAGF